MTCLTQTLGFSVLLTISMLKRSNNNPLSMLHQSLTLQVASLSSGLMVLWWDCAGGIPLRAEQFPLISQSLPQQNRGPEGLVQVMGREPACQLVPLVQVFAIDGTAHLLSFFSQFSVNHHGRQHISFLKMGYRSQKDMKIDDVCGFHLPHHIHHPKKIESHHFQKLYMEVTHMWKIETSWRYCLIAVDGVQHDIWPERFHSTLPRRSAKVSFCWKLSTTASINQFRQFPFPTFWRFFVCAELRDKSCLESMPFFRSFFLPELPVTGIFLNQTKRFCALASSPK